jgi:hypothetical protein
MYLIYVDESGNTGPRLDDAAQPFHFLVGVLVPEDTWLKGYQDWESRVIGKVAHARGSGARIFPELHAVDLYQGQGQFTGIPRRDREEIIYSVLETLGRFDLDVVYAYCDKTRLPQQPIIDPRAPRTEEEKKLAREAGLKSPLLAVNPATEVWTLLLDCCSRHLRHLGPHARGLLIADESKYTEPFAKAWVRSARPRVFHTDPSKPLEQQVLDQPVVPKYPNLVDTVHFVDSRESPYIQLADFVAYFIMRAWRAGNWLQPGPEPHYQKFVRQAIKRALAPPGHPVPNRKMTAEGLSPWGRLRGGPLSVVNGILPRKGAEVNIFGGKNSRGAGPNLPNAWERLGLPLRRSRCFSPSAGSARIGQPEEVARMDWFGAAAVINSMRPVERWLRTWGRPTLACRVGAAIGLTESSSPVDISEFGRNGRKISWEGLAKRGNLCIT